MSKKETAVFAALIITTVISVLSGNIYEAERITSNTLRLHIIANSNSEEDQRYKLYVRDEILEMEDILPVNAQNFDNAVSVTQNNMEEIEKRINTALEEKQAGYGAECSIENFYFDTTMYNGFALPQGEYTALTVRLGKAQGNNWWCVMYPALCSEACGKTVLENSTDYIKTDRITPRFKVVEIYQNIKTALWGTDVQKYDRIE